MFLTVRHLHSPGTFALILSNGDIAAFLEAGYETRAIELKGPGSVNDNAFVSKVARASLAMANQRDGGYIIIGVDEKDRNGSGLTPELILEWNDYDTIVDKLNKYADPPLRIDRAVRRLPNGENIVVLRIEEFDSVPVLAARDFPGILTRGQLYTRSHRKPESSSMLTQNELRHVLELATQKQLAAFVRLANTAGIPVTGEPTDTEKYDAETAQFITSTPAFEVIGAPHFKFAIRPNGYDEERVEYAGLSDAVRQAAIGVRGWPYPFVQAPDLGASWVSEASTVVHKEMWGAFESGQFGSWHNIPRDSDGEYGAYPGRQVVPIWLPVTHFTEVMAFAIRYQALTAPVVPMNIDLELVGATGWTLVAGDGRRAPLHGDYTLKTSHWKRTLAIPAHAKGLVDARDLAVAPSLHLLQRFGWVGANEQIIRSIQADGFGEQQL